MIKQNAIINLQYRKMCREHKISNNLEQKTKDVCSGENLETTLMLRVVVFPHFLCESRQFMVLQEYKRVGCD